MDEFKATMQRVSHELAEFKGKLFMDNPNYYQLMITKNYTKKLHKFFHDKQFIQDLPNLL